MQGFTGAFRFKIDEEGTQVAWESLDAEVKQQLTSAGIDEANSQVYRIKVSTSQDAVQRQKKDVWENVRRVYIEAKPSCEAVEFAGAYPKAEQSAEAHTTTLIPTGTLMNQRLFTQQQFRLEVSEEAKRYSRRDRNSVITAQTPTCAQWVFSDGWNKSEFELFVYAVVPNNLPADKRYIRVNIKPTVKHGEVLNQLCIWEHKINCN